MGGGGVGLRVRIYKEGTNVAYVHANARHLDTE